MRRFVIKESSDRNRFAAFLPSSSKLGYSYLFSMKISFALAALLFFSLNAAAQSADSFKHVDLDEFIYQAGKPKSKRFKARIDNVTLVVRPVDSTNPSSKDTSAYLTHFPAIETKEVSIYEVQCRLDNYDTSQVSMFLIFLQIDGSDTTVRKVCLDRDPIKRHRTTHHFAPGESITVKPTGFYLGYGYRSKSSETVQMSLYCSMREEREGAIANFSKAKLSLLRIEDLSIIFPFTLKYY